MNDPDAAVDVLGAVFPAPNVCECGRVQLCGFGFQRGAAFRVLICAQNLFSTATTLSIASHLFPSHVITFTPSGSAAVACRIDLPLPSASADPVTAIFYLEASFRSEGAGGRRVRPIRRTFLGSWQRRAAVAAVVGAGGGASLSNLWRGDLGTRLTDSCFMSASGVFRAAVAAATDTTTSPSPPRWRQVQLWSDLQVAPPQSDVAALLLAALYDD